MNPFRISATVLAVAVAAAFALAGTGAGAHRHAEEDQGHRHDHHRPSRVVDPVLLPRRQAAAGRLRDGPVHEGRRRGQGRAQDAEPQGQPAAGHLGATASRCCRTAPSTWSAARRPTGRAAEAGRRSGRPTSSSTSPPRSRRTPASRPSPTSTARRSRRRRARPSVPLLKQYEKTKNIDVKEIYGKDHAESFLLLAQDRAAAFVMDDILLAGQIANSPEPGRLRDHRRVAAQEPYSMMLRKDDPQFKALVDKTVGGVMKSGEIDKIYAKWFTEPDPAQGHQHELPDDAGDQGSVRQPERQGRLTQDGRTRRRTSRAGGGIASGRFSRPLTCRVAVRGPHRGAGAAAARAGGELRLELGVFLQEIAGGRRPRTGSCSSPASAGRSPSRACALGHRAGRWAR